MSYVSRQRHIEMQRRLINEAGDAKKEAKRLREAMERAVETNDMGVIRDALKEQAA